ncbi:MAG: response regulator [Pseudomonadota bacterium]
MTSDEMKKRNAQEPASHGRRILVVEDEVLIRLLLCEALRDEGYEVIEACNGDEAANILTAGVIFDLVLSDVRMPGTLDGIGLIDFIRHHQPWLPVILTSAHLGFETAISAGARRFIRKPYEIEKLLHLIELELAEPE